MYIVPLGLTYSSDSLFCGILYNVWAVPGRVTFWTSQMLMLPGIQLMDFFRPFLTSRGAAITTDIFSVFIPHNLLISFSRSFSTTFTEILDSEITATSMMNDMHFFSLLS